MSTLSTTNIKHPSSASNNLVLTNGGATQIGGLTYPTADGSNGQYLKTNGSGTLSWVTPSSPAVEIFAWANYASNGSIQGSYGISSISKGQSGYYTLNLSTTQANANYVAVGSNGNQSIHNVIPGTTTIGVIHIRRTDGAGVDHAGWAGAFR
jgi:hypothetical protein